MEMGMGISSSVRKYLFFFLLFLWFPLCKIILFLGAPLYNNNWQGKAYLVYGKTAFSGSVSLSGIEMASEGIIFYGSTVGEYCGWSVTLVDINKDGRSDVVIGALLLRDKLSTNDYY
jgi:hypothetical protein